MSIPLFTPRKVICTSTNISLRRTISCKDEDNARQLNLLFTILVVQKQH